MADPGVGAGALKVSGKVVSVAFKAVRREMARRNADFRQIDFTSLGAEMNEALEVLSRGSDKLGKAILDYAKGILSDRPEIFEQQVILAWLRTEKAQDLVKAAVEALTKNQPVDSFADEAAGFYATFEGADGELDGRIAFEYAVSFVALSLIRDLTVGEKMILGVLTSRQGSVGPPLTPITETSALHRQLLDAEAERELERLRKWRFFEGNDVPRQATALVERLSSGDLVAASATVRAAAIASCGRWLVTTAPVESSEELLSSANSLAPTEEGIILGAFLAAKSTKLEGLAALSPIDNPGRRTAALQVIAQDSGNAEAIRWFHQAGLSPKDLDSDGQLVLLLCHIRSEDWVGALALVKQITELEYENTPALQEFAASAYLCSAVPPDLHAVVLNGTPLEAADFPLADDPESVANRRKAAVLFGAAAQSAATFGSNELSENLKSSSLWLRLRDPKTQAEARQELQGLLSEGEKGIGCVPLALAFDVELDREAVEAALDRQTAILPKGNMALAIARLALVQHQPNMIAAAEYLTLHREMIVQHLNPAGVLDFEVRIYVAAGRSDDARRRLSESGGILDDTARQLLEDIIAQAENGPSVADLEELYERNPSTANLAQLVALLSRQGFSPRFFELAHELVLATKSLTDAERTIRFLQAHNRTEEISELLSAIPELISSSVDLRSAYAWSEYHLGRLGNAQTVLDGLRAERDEANDRGLQVNLLMTSGRWPEIVGFINSEFAVREKRTPAELLSLAQLGVHVGAARTWDIVIATAEAGADDENILLGCYFVAVQLAREEDPRVSEWFAKAVELSGDEGPIQLGSLEELVAQAPDWDRQVNDTWEKWRRGEIPIVVAGQLLRRTALDLQLSSMVSNRAENDVRRRSVVPAYSGARNSGPRSGAAIALDSTALINLASVGVLDKVIEKWAVSIPHSTLGNLFEERQKLAFHQPSRIKSAHTLSRAVADGKLRRFTATAVPDPALGDLVGRSLAAMLATATTREADQTQHLVVRAGPVHRVGSLRSEEVDVSAFANVLCSCCAVVDRLSDCGLLTADEETRARKYLSQNEQSWANEPVICDGAHLYLDDLSIAHLRAAAVFDKLPAAGIIIFVPERELEEAQALLDLERNASAIEEVIEQVRENLARGIEGGGIRVDRVFKNNDLGSHPTISLIQLAASVDALVCDDRFMNQHPQMLNGDRETAIWTTMDLLAAMVVEDDLKAEEAWLVRTKLRQSGLIHLPSSNAELTSLLGRAGTREEYMIETAELRAFRENLELAQMRGWLQLPTEAPWLQQLVSSVVATIRAQWVPSIPDKVARIKSRWLVDRADMRNWVQKDVNHDASAVAEYGLALVVSSLLLSHFDDDTGDAYDRFSQWLQDDVIAEMKASEPLIFDWMVARLRDVLGHRFDQVIEGNS